MIAEAAELQSGLRETFVQEHVANEREINVNNTSASDKIEMIQQRFTAFEIKYMQFKHEFIGSFRNLDERHGTPPTP